MFIFIFLIEFTFHNENLLLIIFLKPNTCLILGHGDLKLMTFLIFVKFSDLVKEILCFFFIFNLPKPIGLKYEQQIPSKDPWFGKIFDYNLRGTSVMCGNTLASGNKIRNSNIRILEFSFFYSKGILLINRKTSSNQERKEQVNK